jgi:hypothetical protein
MYSNQPIVDGKSYVPYTDTFEPRVFANASPLDPQLFSTVGEHAQDLLANRASAKYSPAEVAVWLDRLSRDSGQALAQMGAPKSDAEKRLADDIAILRGIAGFFAAKMRSATLFALWQKNSDPALGAAALEQYRHGRAVWSAMAERAKAVYAGDVSYGEIPQRRGHWSDRLPAIDADIADMAKAVGAVSHKGALTGIGALVTKPAARPVVAVRHTAPEHFTAGSELPLSMRAKAESADLLYRHVNQGERWRSVAMNQSGDDWRGVIPSDYTRSPFPLQYYFVLHNGAQASMHPGFNATLSNQPYYAVWKRS